MRKQLDGHFGTLDSTPFDHEMVALAAFTPDLPCALDSAAPAHDRHALSDRINILRVSKNSAMTALAGTVVLGGLPASLARADTLDRESNIPAAVAPLEIKPTPMVQLDNVTLASNQEVPSADDSEPTLTKVFHGVEAFFGIGAADLTDDSGVTEDLKPLPSLKDSKQASHAEDFASVGLDSFTKQSSGLVLTNPIADVELPSPIEFLQTNFERMQAVFKGQDYVTPEMKNAIKLNAVQNFSAAPEDDTTSPSDPNAPASSKAKTKVTAAKTPAVEGKTKPSMQSESYMSDVMYPLVGDTNKTALDINGAQAKIEATQGTQAVLLKQGTVLEITNPKQHRDDKLGSSILFEDATDGSRWAYEGLGRGTITVHEGETVKAGQVVGEVGTKVDGGGDASQLILTHLPQQYDGVVLDTIPVVPKGQVFPLAIEDLNVLQDSKLVADQNASKAYGTQMLEDEVAKYTQDSDLNNQDVKDVTPSGFSGFWAAAKNVFAHDDDKSTASQSIPDLIGNFGNDDPTTPATIPTTGNTATTDQNDPNQDPTTEKDTPNTSTDTASPSTSNKPAETTDKTTQVDKNDPTTAAKTQPTNPNSSTSPATTPTTGNTATTDQNDPNQDIDKSIEGKDNQGDVTSPNTSNGNDISSMLNGFLHAKLGDMTQKSGGNFVASNDPTQDDANDPGTGTTDGNTSGTIPDAVGVTGDKTDDPKTGDTKTGTTTTTPEQKDPHSPLKDDPKQPAKPKATTHPAVTQPAKQPVAKKPTTSTHSSGHSSSPKKKESHKSSHKDDNKDKIDRSIIPKNEPNNNNNDKRALWDMNYLVENVGLTPAGAAAVIGNLSVESANTFNPNINQFGGGVGRGIAQWSAGQRWETLKTWTSNHGYSAYSSKGQLEFLEHELEKTYPGTAHRLKNNHDVANLTEDFEVNFERAGSPNIPERKQRAKQYLKMYNKAING